jgi:hypothetical protein
VDIWLRDYKTAENLAKDHPCERLSNEDPVLCALGLAWFPAEFQPPQSLPKGELRLAIKTLAVNVYD